VTTTTASDPKPSVDRIDELARRILSGDILLPKFQREFVWKKPRILALLDSIAKNYPVGSILLWRTRQELKNERKIADLDVAQQEQEYPFNYLLDGQQRLSTICGALFWNGTDPKSQWNIAYDLRDQKFLHPLTVGDLPLHQLRVNKLSNPSQYFQHVGQIEVGEAPDKALLVERARQLFDRFKDYKIAVVTLPDMSISDVAPIFERINSQGVPLTRVDLLRAATWSKEFDLIEAVEGLRSELEERNFRDFDTKAILRNLSASQGGGFTIDQIEHLRRNTPAANTAGVNVTKEAYKRTLDFLATEIGVVGSGALPYTNQVTVLAEAFRLMPTAVEPARLLSLQKWFWRTSLAGYFGGWNTGQMAKDLKAVRDFAADTAAELPVPSGRPSMDIWSSKTFKANTALAKTFALLLSRGKPRDLWTGTLIDTKTALSWINQKEFHHFFPKKFVRDTSQDEPNRIANIIFLTSASNKTISAKSPREYLSAAKERLGADYAAVLASNLISEEAMSAALANDYTAFVAARSKTIDGLASQLAAWPSDTPQTDVNEESEETES
jgi:hypothetical protein